MSDMQMAEVLKWLRYERLDGVPEEERRRQCAALIEQCAARHGAPLDALEKGYGASMAALALSTTLCAYLVELMAEHDRRAVELLDALKEIETGLVAGKHRIMDMIMADAQSIARLAIAEYGKTRD